MDERVLVVRNFAPLRTLGERQPSVINHRWIVSRIELAVPSKVFNFLESIRQTFQVVPIEQLSVSIEVLFSSGVFVQAEFIRAQPEGIVFTEEEVVSVKTYVFDEVLQFHFDIVVPVQVPARVVCVDYEVAVFSRV